MDRGTAATLDTTKCPICGEITGMTATPRASTSTTFECRRCGEYTITWLLLSAGIPAEIRPYLSAATRQATERGQPLTVTNENFRDLAEAHQRTTVSEKLDKVLAFIASKTRAPGTSHAVLKN